MAGETKLVDYIQQQLRDAGAYVTKNHGGAFQPRGRPDLEVCFRGLYLAIEVKVPGNKPTTVQSFTLDEIRDAGGWAGTISSREQIDQLITYWPSVCRRCIRLRCSGCG